ncbi:MAG: hypothetical protein J6125_03800, partial [Clostridia bacterium]|nr:hypothetical protein [Clostridia bacterium]
MKHSRLFSVLAMMLLIVLALGCYSCSKDKQDGPDTSPVIVTPTDPQSDAPTDPQSDPQSDAPTEPQSDPQSDPETDPQSDPETDPQTVPQTDPQTEPQTDPPIDPPTACDHSGNTNPRSCTESTVCSVCGASLAATGHEWYIASHDDATCQSYGRTHYGCRHCDTEKVIRDTYPGLHHYEGGVCTLCGESATLTATAQDCDDVLMPDRFNTGANAPAGPYADHTLTRPTETGEYNGVWFVISGNSVTIDRSKMVIGSSKELVIRDMDFSGMSFGMISNLPEYTFAGENFDDGHGGVDMTGGRFVIKFVNCKLTGISTERAGVAQNVCNWFDHCTVKNFSGSNVVFDWCFFGGNDYADAMNPFQNVFVQNVYVCDKESIKYDSEMHTDATQIFGYGPAESTVVAQNIHHYNYRGEMPSVYYTGSQAYTNSILMISLDYNDADNISFVHCYINGTGCPIMINDHPHGGGTSYGSNNGFYRMTNVLYRDITHGCAHTYANIISSQVVDQFTGQLKPGTSSQVVMEDWDNETTTLLAGSVWQKDGKTYVCVANDTNRDRDLTIVYPGGKVNYMIPKCPLRTEFKEDMVYLEFPFDVMVDIDGTPAWIVCYDTTDGVYQQIRCYNPGGETITIRLDELGAWRPATEQYAYDIAANRLIRQPLIIDIPVTGGQGIELSHNFEWYVTERYKYANSRGVYGRAVASFDVSICPSKVYDGQPYDLGFEITTPGYDQNFLQYKWLKGGVVLPGAPTDVGRYVV